MRLVFGCLAGEEPRLVEDKYFILATRTNQPDFGRLRRVSIDAP